MRNIVKLVGHPRPATRLFETRLDSLLPFSGKLVRFIGINKELINRTSAIPNIFLPSVNATKWLITLELNIEYSFVKVKNITSDIQIIDCWLEDERVGGPGWEKATLEMIKYHRDYLRLAAKYP
jgi:hypothetical protein